MSERLTLAAAAEHLRLLSHASGGAATRERLKRLAELAEATPGADDIGVGDVLAAAFADADDPLVRFRELRHSLGELSKREGIAIECVIDGHKRASPEQRRCWFVGEPAFDWIERHSYAASETPPDTIEGSQGRLAIRSVCIDLPPAPQRCGGGELARMRQLGLELAAMIERALACPNLAVTVTDTAALAGEQPRDVRAERLATADLVICLLTHDYLREYGASAADDDRSVIAVALEPLPDDRWPQALGVPFADGRPFDRHDNKPRFVGQLCETVRRRVSTPTDDAWMAHTSDPGSIVVKVWALPTELDRESPTVRQRDGAVLVQDHLTAWAAKPAPTSEPAPPYLVIFGETGMGKTTACRLFTRRLIDRRRDGDRSARRPILFDLKNLSAAGRSAPTLEGLLADLLNGSWQAGAGPRPRAAEIIEHVQERGAVVIFDGLDEVLVALDDREGQAFLRRLWSILPPALLRDKARRLTAGRVMFSCRTHFFRTIAEQHMFFRGEDRDSVGVADYDALHLLPFDHEQIRAYLEARDRDGRGVAGGVDRALELMKTIHDLPEIVARPHNLGLVADLLESLGQQAARGERIDTAALYGGLVARWLERDAAKHQLRKDDKPRLMDDLAAHMWRDGRRALPVAELEDWLNTRLLADDEVGRWHKAQGKDVAVLAEDLRTATFVVRPGADGFQFAHTSLLEYFLARRLARALADDEPDGWALPAPSVETLDFVGEIVASGDHARCLHGLRTLRDAYRPQASENALAYCLRAIERDAPAVALAGFALSGAKLRGLRTIGPDDGTRLSFAGASFAGADLRYARFERVRLDDCNLRGADLTCAELHDCVLERVALDDAVLAGTIVRDCRAPQLDLRGARGYRTHWLRCDLPDVRWPDEAVAHLAAGLRRGPAPSAAPDSGDAWVAAFTGHTSTAFDRLDSGLTLIEGGVFGVALSADGSRAVGAGDDRTVRVWDLANGEQLHALQGHTSPVRGVALSADGSRAVSAGDDRTVRVWDLANGEQLHALQGHTSPVRGVALSADGSRAVSAGDDRTVRVWDLANGEQLHALQGHTARVRGVALSADGSRAVSAGDDHTVRVWDLANGEHQHALQGHTNWVRGVALSADGSRAVSAGDDHTVRVWDLANGERLHALQGHTGRVLSVALSPDGSRAVSASADRTVRVWDLASGEQLRALQGHTNWVLAVALAADGSRAVSAGDDHTVRVWDLANGEQLHALKATSARCSGSRCRPTGHAPSAPATTGPYASGTSPTASYRSPSKVTPAGCVGSRSRPTGHAPSAPATTGPYASGTSPTASNCTP